MYHFSRNWYSAGLPLLVLAITVSSGCLTSNNTRIPMVVNRPAEVERREAQIQDPYPDSTFGPDTGFRPLGYTVQRAEPQRAKDRFYTAKLRSSGGGGQMPQAMAPTYYPQAIPVSGAYATPQMSMSPPAQPQVAQPVATPMYYPPAYR